jgi:glycerophosphoryl diester phosphodiesterase
MTTASHACKPQGIHRPNMTARNCRYVLAVVTVSVGVFVSCLANATRAEEPGSIGSVYQVVAHRGASAVAPECTLACVQAAMKTGATAIEVDVRTTKDNVLVVLHDTTVDRTTNGSGKINDLTWDQVRNLDAGSWFDSKFKDQRIPRLRDVLKVAKGRVDILLDLKETSDAFATSVTQEVKKYGAPKETIIGVRTIEHAKSFRKTIRGARQLALPSSVDLIEEFAAAKVDMIRIWPKWLKNGDAPIRRVRACQVALHLNGTDGTVKDVTPLLKHKPESLSSDDPAKLVKTLNELGAFSTKYKQRAR